MTSYIHPHMWAAMLMMSWLPCVAAQSPSTATTEQRSAGPATITAMPQHSIMTHAVVDRSCLVVVDNWDGAVRVSTIDMRTYPVHSRTYSSPVFLFAYSHVEALHITGAEISGSLEDRSIILSFTYKDEVAVRYGLVPVEGGLTWGRISGSAPPVILRQESQPPETRPKRTVVIPLPTTRPVSN